MEKRYDVIVVGAGNGGLAAAANTAKEGLSTLLLEKHNITLNKPILVLNIVFMFVIKKSVYLTYKSCIILYKITNINKAEYDRVKRTR